MFTLAEKACDAPGKIHGRRARMTGAMHLECLAGILDLAHQRPRLDERNRAGGEVRRTGAHRFYERIGYQHTSVRLAKEL